MSDRMKHYRPIVRRALRKMYFLIANARAPQRVAALEENNRTSTETILGSEDVVVSITTYGRRIGSVHIAIESIATGIVKPRRIILWLDDESAFNSPPSSLTRLIKRGLEIRLSENYGPHTKYYPFVRDIGLESGFLVTADDDVVVPRYWLRNLLHVARAHPNEITCYRAHRFELRSDMSLVPYNDWRECWSQHPSILNFPTGVSGCAYPPGMVEALRSGGEAFRSSAPKSDDVWIHSVSVLEGIPIRQVWSMPMEFPLVPDSQGQGLFHENVLEGQNDKQMEETYSADTLTTLFVEQNRRVA